jgi:hypothetical protein
MEDYWANLSLEVLRGVVWSVPRITFEAFVVDCLVDSLLLRSYYFLTTVLGVSLSLYAYLEARRERELDLAARLAGHFLPEPVKRRPMSTLQVLIAAFAEPSLLIAVNSDYRIYSLLISTVGILLNVMHYTLLSAMLCITWVRLDYETTVVAVPLVCCYLLPTLLAVTGRQRA